MLTVDPRRLDHMHRDGTPLCPEITGRGAQPFMPVVAK
jgi:hypothetical protein